MKKVFVLGSINMDLVICADRIPNKGETMIGNKFFMSPGGKGANQAVAIAKQGIKTNMLGSLGDDPLSEDLMKALVNENVNCQHVNSITNTTCGIATIMVIDGDNRIIINQGANGIHDVEEIKRILQSECTRDDYLVSQLEIPIEVINQVFPYAKSLGMTTFLNAAPAFELSDELYSNVDYLMLNEVEAKMLTGSKDFDGTDVKNISTWFFSRGVRAVVFTLGAQGSIYVTSNEVLITPSYSVDVIDTTAAGDTFIGYFVSELALGTSVAKVLKIANAAAALAIQKLGAQGSIPSKNDVLNFLMQEEGK